LPAAALPRVLRPTTKLCSLDASTVGGGYLPQGIYAMKPRAPRQSLPSYPVVHNVLYRGADALCWWKLWGQGQAAGAAPAMVRPRWRGAACQCGGVPASGRLRI